MYQKLQGIVLNNISYNDKYSLVQIYTDTSGRVTYMLPRSASKKASLKKSMFSPFSILDMEVEHRPSREIQRIKEARPIFPLHAIVSDMRKVSMVFFLSEFLVKVLRDVNDNAAMFRFLVNSVEILEYTEKSIANFHLVFILRLTHFLGFYPNLEEYANGDYFDMLNGSFTGRQPLHTHYINPSGSQALSRLARISFENMHLFRFSRKERVEIVERMLEYYRIHLHDFPPMKSLDVLHELFE